MKQWAQTTEGEAGKLTFRIPPGTQTKTLFRLLSSYYKRLPEIDKKIVIQATVSFYSKGSAKRQMPIDAEIQLEVGDEEITFPYHPCLAAFFFDRDYYDMRRRLVSQNLAE